MNILIIVSSLSYGGAEKQVVEDAGLLSRNHHVTILAFADGPLSGLIDSGVQLLIRKRDGYLKTVFRLLGILKKNRIDLIHAHLYAPMVISALAGKLAGVPVVWNFHSHAYENSLKGKIIHKLAAKLSSVKKILFPATELQTYYEQRGYAFPGKKCIPGYNSGQENDGSRENSEVNPFFKIGYVGRVIPLKQLHLLPELATFLHKNNSPPFEIHIVGDGAELSRIKSRAMESGNSECFWFHGFRKDTLSFYRRFDFFVLPSSEEVLSLSLIDAGLSGLPAVAFNVGGNHEIVIDQITGILAENTQDFFGAVLELMNDTERYKKMGNAARQHCLKYFSPEARLNFLETLYAELI